MTENGLFKVCFGPNLEFLKVFQTFGLRTHNWWAKERSSRTPQCTLYWGTGTTIQRVQQIQRCTGTVLYIGRLLYCTGSVLYCTGSVLYCTGSVLYCTGSILY